MTETIRILDKYDYPLLEAMHTGLEEDYVKRVFDRLVTGDNRLYGLFYNGRMVSMAGFSIYKERYAMLGRLRSDRRYNGNGFSTALLEYIMHEAFQLNGIEWVGANTEEHNLPARRILKKIGLTPYTALHTAVTKDASMLQSGARPWKRVTELSRKKEFVHKHYVQPGAIFPYECYYPFPASEALFQEQDLKEWSFYENEAKNRFLITKPDQKKHHYLHAIYPWSDITEQNGLWETVEDDYREFSRQTDGDTYIWMDLTKEEADSLPSNHPFDLPSPWILYGTAKAAWLEARRVMHNRIAFVDSQDDFI
ncbi:GNAT family N-acetyltransferase [Lentibacillus juripiscarius]|uniref:GNAT family N-acetyltransferase n=1 Tax=Lentibacillus juripiscarius TaxID=257446 RepID=A0ABW5V5A1_9BACI